MDPYVRRQPDVVAGIVVLQDVGKNDVVIAVAFGDVPVLETVVKHLAARAFGVHIDEARIAEGRANAKQADVDYLVELDQQDAMQADISQDNVETPY